jgi:hypothetical protein
MANRQYNILNPQVLFAFYFDFVCHPNAIFKAYLKSGEILPDFIYFNPLNTTFIVYSNNSDEAGDYMIKVTGTYLDSAQ